MIVDFSTPRKKPSTEAVLPMINVVFLLLIFFLMTTRIATQAPFAVVPPVTELESQSENTPVIFMSAEGVLFFEGIEGDAVLGLLEPRAIAPYPLTLRADAEVSAKNVAALLARLRDMGITSINIVGQNG
ncbi:biopolymer transporter ExbD [Shimia sp. SDUM112013]|uniref:ExbD/TolR family protein n=1 Tax=Shimia sp. SDUM112013 TaxID=3136160 RepID=UPI0032EFC2EE